MFKAITISLVPGGAKRNDETIIGEIGWQRKQTCWRYVYGMMLPMNNHKFNHFQFPIPDIVLKAKDVKKGDTFGAFGQNEE